jgi:ECF transporter S component (folate family)
MKKVCEILGVKKLSVKEMCTLGLLIALTLLMSVYATLRIGNSIKVSMKFIPVFIAGVLFGPVPAALTSFLGDLLNSVIFPVGAWMPQISLTEFLSGFIFGACFYKKTNLNVSYVVRTIICVACHFVLSIVVTSYFLTQVGYFPSLAAAMAVRFPASAMKVPLQAAVAIISTSYLPVLNKILNK